jgi:hypothetical protein
VVRAGVAEVNCSAKVAELEPEGRVAPEAAVVEFLGGAEDSGGRP